MSDSAGFAFFPLVCAGEQEYRLTKYLMSNYERSVRPVAQSATPINVLFDVSIHQIIDVDEKNQILTTNCWITHIWNDSHLTWNASDFGNVSTVRLPHDKVADSNYNMAIINTNVIVSYTGEVVWLSHGIFKSSCDISVEYFPFDVQTCNMKWSSWTYDGTSLNMTIINVTGDTSNYQKNGEFEMEEFVPYRHEKYYTCCKEPYYDITYSIRLRRRPMFYVFNLILPCVLINGIALLVFYVPSESGEKVTLGISALLSMTVFLMTIRESLPPTENTPLISLYYGVSICLVSFASAMAVVTLNIHHRGVRGNEVPAVIKSVVLGFLSKFVFLHFDTSIKKSLSLQATKAKASELRANEKYARMNGYSQASFGLSTVLPYPTHEQFQKPPQVNLNQDRILHPSANENGIVSPSGPVDSPSNDSSSLDHNELRLETEDVGRHSMNGNDNANIRLLLRPQGPSRQPTLEEETALLSPPSHLYTGGSLEGTLRLITNAAAAASSSTTTTTNNGGGRNPPLCRMRRVTSVEETICNPLMEKVLDKISATIDRNEVRNAESDARDKFAIEWKQVSLVLDRILLLIFFLAVSICSVVILTSSPHLFRPSVQEKGRAPEHEEVQFSASKAMDLNATSTPDSVENSEE
ncbi:hypothetical protein TCAL_12201 [Tigriopus californicus]|uniref:Neurotransmitter-gated ion-channel ligand-binding domain-containing protein n=1 Tax=Tigriopus californicus TaxID=6832 RepID=A0A553NUN1_TIGCA|nr:hypothetical protein TCAL_12201 [Tigriopus californicus]